MPPDLPFIVYVPAERLGELGAYSLSLFGAEVPVDTPAELLGATAISILLRTRLRDEIRAARIVAAREQAAVEAAALADQELAALDRIRIEPVQP